MTRLTSLFLWDVRGKDPEPIPFPTQFCNMIYLTKIILGSNNFSGFERNLSCNLFIFLGPIPVDLIRLVGLRRLNITHEPLLEGFMKIYFDFNFCFVSKFRKISSC